ncbi:hypothetical protein GmHk_18G050553 [Glycine max]|nr:hypothetical protein GYH30_048799 [Glycine max]KAH1196559.1 hypothetical protein GmHk_18G050553 [Glycine max]KHN31305.1 hypothetical protein glysoja_022959 [Glycine soja]
MALHTRICCDNLAKRVQASLLVVHPFANDGDADDAKDIDGAHGLANTATHVEDSVAGPGLNTDEDACNGDVGVGDWDLDRMANEFPLNIVHLKSPCSSARHDYVEWDMAADGNFSES